MSYGTYTYGLDPYGSTGQDASLAGVATGQSDVQGNIVLEVGIAAAAQGHAEVSSPDTVWVNGLSGQTGGHTIMSRPQMIVISPAHVQDPEVVITVENPEQPPPKADDLEKHWAIDKRPKKSSTFGD